MSMARNVRARAPRGLEDAYIKAAEEILTSSASHIGVVVSDADGMCLTTAGPFFTSESAGHVATIVAAAKKLGGGNSDDEPVIQIRTDNSEILISSNRGYYTSIAREVNQQ